MGYPVMQNPHGLLEGPCNVSTKRSETATPSACIHHIVHTPLRSHTTTSYS